MAAALLMANFSPAIDPLRSSTIDRAPEGTTFAAFTALIVFVGGVCGVSLGRWLIDRNAPPAPKHDHAGDSGERTDTDVFAAVTADKTEEQS